LALVLLAPVLAPPAGAAELHILELLLLSILPLLVVAVAGMVLPLPKLGGEVEERVVLGVLEQVALLLMAVNLNHNFGVEQLFDVMLVAAVLVVTLAVGNLLNGVAAAALELMALVAGGQFLVVAVVDAAVKFVLVRLNKVMAEALLRIQQIFV
jgi:hypothetical protein